MRFSICAAALIAAATPVAAATVTVDFKEIGNFETDGRSASFTDEGFFATSVLPYWEGGDITLHDDGGIISTEIRPERGGRFTPKSIDLAFGSRFKRTGSGPRPVDDDGALFDWVGEGVVEQAVIRLTGWFRNSASVFIELPSGTNAVIAFGSEFAGINGLLVEIIYPAGVRLLDGHATAQTYDIEQVTQPGQIWCGDYCSGAVLDNLVADLPDPVAPVPLPATAFLLGAALLPLVRRRRT